MKTLRTVVVVFFVSMLSIIGSACGQDQGKQVSNEISEALRSPNAFDSIDRLVAIDQKYDSMDAKINIGALYLKIGELEKAGTYLLPLASKVGSQKTQTAYVVHSNLASYHFALGQQKECEASAIMAIAAHADDYLGVQVVLAKSLFRQGRVSESRPRFDEVWDSNTKLFNPEDMQNYIEVLVKEKQWTRALTVAQKFETQLGYARGIGYTQALILETFGNYNAAILSVFKDILYQVEHGDISKETALKACYELREKLPQNRSKQDLDATLDLIKGIEEFIKGNHRKIVEIIPEKGFEFDNSFGTFLRLYARILSGNGEMATLSELVAIESDFKMYLPYYVALWAGMKAGSGKYEFNVLRPILERVIVLADRSPVSERARSELGKLLQLTPDQSRSLLIPIEVDAIASHLLNGSVDQLPILVKAMSLPSNAYSDYALRALPLVFRNPAGAQWMTENRKTLSPDLQRRAIEIGQWSS